MKRKEAFKPITYMKTNSADLLKEAKSGPVFITQNGEAKAVVQDIEEYNRTNDTLLLLRILALGEADIRSGKINRQQDVFSQIEKAMLK